MTIIPAIDLRRGRCVRLEQGDYNRETVYDPDPPAVARRFVAAGAKRLHLVDLDGAKAGAPVQKELIVKVARSIPVPVEAGGGIRDQETIQYYLENGVQWVILGSAAVHNPGLLLWACRRYPGRIILGLDARDGLVAVEGWLKTTDLEAVELAQKIAGYGVTEVIYTDISRDGTLQGPNLKALQNMVEKSGLSVIASGGIASLADLYELKKLEPLGLSGAIVGKALYNGNIDLAEAIHTLEAADGSE